MKTTSSLRTSIHLYIVGLLSLFLSGCGEKYEPLGPREPLTIETNGTIIENLSNGYYAGIVASDGISFSLKIPNPNCAWIGLSGVVNGKDYFRMEENEESLEEEWGSIRYVSNSHPFEFDVVIGPNYSNEERVITIDLQYGNSFGTLKLTQLAE